MPEAGTSESWLGLGADGACPITLEVSIDMVHPDDGTDGMVFPTAPWKGLINPSMQVGLISGPDAS